jgi:hypothetical protein
LPTCSIQRKTLERGRLTIQVWAAVSPGMEETPKTH